MDVENIDALNPAELDALLERALDPQVPIELFYAVLERIGPYEQPSAQGPGPAGTEASAQGQGQGQTQVQVQAQTQGPVQGQVQGHGQAQLQLQVQMPGQGHAQGSGRSQLQLQVQMPGQGQGQVQGQGQGQGNVQGQGHAQGNAQSHGQPQLQLPVAVQASGGRSVVPAGQSAAQPPAAGKPALSAGPGSQHLQSSQYPPVSQQSAQHLQAPPYPQPLPPAPLSQSALLSQPPLPVQLPQPALPAQLSQGPQTSVPNTLPPQTTTFPRQQSNTQPQPNTQPNTQPGSPAQQANPPGAGQPPHASQASSSAQAASSGQTLAGRRVAQHGPPPRGFAAAGSDVEATPVLRAITDAGGPWPNAVGAAPTASEIAASAGAPTTMLPVIPASELDDRSANPAAPGERSSSGSEVRGDRGEPSSAS